MNSYISSSELTHYGVKGMKWGIRRDRSHAKNGSRKKKNAKSLRDRAKATLKKFKPAPLDLESTANASANYLRRQASADNVADIIRYYNRKGITSIDEKTIKAGQEIVDSWLLSRYMYEMWSK